MNGSLFWLLLRYAEIINPNALVKSAPPVSSSYYYECLRKSGHGSDAAWQESLQAFKNYRAARCRLENTEELRCRIRLSQEYLNELQYLP